MGYVFKITVFNVLNFCEVLIKSIKYVLSYSKKRFLWTGGMRDVLNFGLIWLPYCWRKDGQTEGRKDGQMDGWTKWYYRVPCISCGALKISSGMMILWKHSTNLNRLYGQWIHVCKHTVKPECKILLIYFLIPEVSTALLTVGRNAFSFCQNLENTMYYTETYKSG